MIITGGSEAALTHVGLGAFASMRALSERNDDPARASRPFDRDRDGFVLSEGRRAVGAGRAGTRQGPRRPYLRRSLRLRRQLRRPATSPRPDKDGVGAAYAMAQALKDAEHRSRRHRLHQRPRHQHARWATPPKPSPSSTSSGARRSVSISSTKSQLGHLLGASGGVELILSLLAMRDG